jgi:hypothetical protein
VPEAPATFDDDRLAEWLAHALGHDAADGICKARQLRTARPM